MYLWPPVLMCVCVYVSVCVSLPLLLCVLCVCRLCASKVHGPIEAALRRIEEAPRATEVDDDVSTWIIRDGVEGRRRERACTEKGGQGAGGQGEDRKGRLHAYDGSEARPLGHACVCIAFLWYSRVSWLVLTPWLCI